MHTEGEGRGAPHVPPIKIFEKLLHKNAIKHDTPPPDFLTTPSTPLKRICQKTPRTPPLDLQLLCIYDGDAANEGCRATDAHGGGGGGGKI